MHTLVVDLQIGQKMILMLQNIVMKWLTLC
jgi:hypothetical protein